MQQLNNMLNKVCCSVVPVAFLNLGINKLELFMQIFNEHYFFGLCKTVTQLKYIFNFVIDLSE